MGHLERLRAAQGRARRHARILPLDRRRTDHDANAEQPGAHGRPIQSPDGHVATCRDGVDLRVERSQLPLPGRRRGSASQLLRAGFERHDSLGGNHLPHAAQEPARPAGLRGNRQRVVVREKKRAIPRDRPILAPVQPIEANAASRSGWPRRPEGHVRRQRDGYRTPTSSRNPRAWRFPSPIAWHNRPRSSS